MGAGQVGGTVPGSESPSLPGGPPPAIAVRDLVKRYGGVVALDGMSLTVAAGTIHAIVGENGAGKSTLMKSLAGVVRPDAGEIELDGHPVRLGSPRQAAANGIGIVYQELSIFPPRSVLANLFVDREPTRWGLVSTRAMKRQAAGVLARIGLDVDLDGPAGTLPMGDRQLVEVCRVLLTRPRLLILDEPNSALSEAETTRLFTALRKLKAEGITILYVSHRLEEVLEIADRITVMRNGREALTRERSEATMAEVVAAMVGSHEELFPSAGPPPRRSASVRVQELSVGKALRDVSFTARAGEIVGLAGVEGSGVAALLSVLFGARKPDSGRFDYPDGKGLPTSPTAAARRGISLVPADRRKHGLMLEASVARNVAHVAVGALRTASPWLSPNELRRRALHEIAALRIKTPSPWTTVGRLSGGNQQKVVFGKWLEVQPEMVLLDDPTRGVDIGAKREMYTIIRRLAGDGRVVLFRSTELPELIGLCDRILVFYRGRLVGEVGAREADSRTLLHAINTGELDGRRSSGVTRRAFTMKLKPGGLDGYRRHHDAIWPELVAEIERSGIAQITIFENDPVLVLYSEIRDEDAWDRLWATEVHARWGAIMNDFMAVDETGAPEFAELREVFHLESGA